MKGGLNDLVGAATKIEDSQPLHPKVYRNRSRQKGSGLHLMEWIYSCSAQIGR